VVPNIFGTIKTGEFIVKNPTTLEETGRVTLKGESANKQLIIVNKSSIETTLAAIATGADSNVDYSNAGVTQDEIKLFDNLENDRVTPNFRSLGIFAGWNWRNCWGFGGCGDFVVLNRCFYLLYVYGIILIKPENMWCSVANRVRTHVCPRQENRSL
ncbi:MAG: hypothetical protein ACKVP5_03895, partial [Aestuariivirga sp.]